MKAAICAIDSQYIHSALAPWCLVAGVAAYAKRPAECEVIETTINQPLEVILEKISRSEAQVFAISCYIWNIGIVEQIGPALRTMRPQARIVLGGPEVSFRPGQILQQWGWVDMVLCGEGERPFAMLLDALAAGTNVAHVPGLCYRVQERLVCQPMYLPQDEPPSPYTQGYLQTLNGRIAYLETTRGCPFSCSFCLSGVEQGVRFFSLERAKREMLLLARSGARTIKLVDRTFNCHPGRAYELFAFLIEHAGKEIPPGVCFHFEVGADLFDERTLALLRTAPTGLIQMEAGLQSFYPPTLEAIRRKTDIEKLEHNLRALIAMDNMHIHIDLIAGLPYEDAEEFGRSFDRAFALRPHMLQLGFLKMLHGSPIRGQAEQWRYRFDSRAPYEITENQWLSQTDRQMLHVVEDVLERMYNSGRFLQTLDYLLSATGLRPFALFTAMGQGIAGLGETAGVSLDDYTERIWQVGQTLKGVAPMQLRDALVTDRLCTENTGRIPPCLRVEDRRLKRYTKEVRARACYQTNPGVKAGTAILYAGTERLLVVDYARREALRGRYAWHIEPIQDEQGLARTGNGPVQ